MTQSEDRRPTGERAGIIDDQSDNNTHDSQDGTYGREYLRAVTH